DELANPLTHAGLDRVEPIVEKIHSCIGDRLRGIMLRANALHGVVSYPTLQRRRFEVEHPGDYATFNSNQLRDGTHQFMRGVASLGAPSHPAFLEPMQTAVIRQPSGLRPLREVVAEPVL